MKKKVIIGAVILVVIVGVILGFGLFKSDKNGKVKYRTEAVAKGDIEALVVTSGTLDAVTVVDIGSQVSGKIDKLFADFNSNVKAGQIVAQLDLDLLQAKIDQNEANNKSAIASLEQAKVALDNSKKKYDRSLDLFQKNQISVEEKENAEANYLNAKANVISADSRLTQAQSQLDSSKVDLSYAIIKSPIDGVVITRNVNVGQTVAASYTAPVLFKVASDLTKMQLSCNIDEADIGKVKETQKVRFTVDAFPGENFTGQVRQVRYASQVVSNVVTYTTIVDAENPELKLRPGMTATVSIVVNEAKDVLKVANAALRYTPTLDPKELEKIQLEMRQKMGGNQPGDKTQGGQTGNRSQGGQGGQRSALSGDLSAEQLARLQAQARNRQRTSGQVWVQNDLGKLFPVFVRLGITDNNYTEVRGGELKEGMKILLGEENPASAAKTTQQGMGFGQPTMIRMGGGPGR
jgi:HlyD family secretion protein